MKRERPILFMMNVSFIERAILKLRSTTVVLLPDMHFHSKQKAHKLLEIK